MMSSKKRNDFWAPHGAELGRRLKGFLRARVGSETDREDIAQTFRVKMLEHGHRYDEKRSHGRVWVWAKPYAKRAISEFYRKTLGDAPQEEPVHPARSPLEYECLLAATFQAPSEPHQLLTFGLIELLEWRPREIVVQLSEQTLEDLGNRFVADYAKYFPCHRNRVLDLLQPFTERLRGDRRLLKECFESPDDPSRCAANLSRWRYAVKRRVKADFVYLGRLEQVLSVPLLRHQQIVYGLVVILGWSLSALGKHVSRKLRWLAEQLEAGCTGKKPHLRDIIKRLFQPVRRDPSLDRSTLRETVPPGFSLETSVEECCREVEAALQGMLPIRGVES